MDINWVDGFRIKVEAEGEGAVGVDGEGAGRGVVIKANREGLLSLADQLRDLAEEAPGSHIRYDEWNSLEEGSAELIIEKTSDN